MVFFKILRMTIRRLRNRNRIRGREVSLLINLPPKDSRADSRFTMLDSLKPEGMVNPGSAWGRPNLWEEAQKTHFLKGLLKAEELHHSSSSDKE